MRFFRVLFHPLTTPVSCLVAVIGKAVFRGKKNNMHSLVQKTKHLEAALRCAEDEIVQLKSMISKVLPSPENAEQCSRAASDAQVDVEVAPNDARLSMDREESPCREHVQCEKAQVVFSTNEISTLDPMACSEPMHNVQTTPSWLTKMGYGWPYAPVSGYFQSDFCATTPCARKEDMREQERGGMRR